MDLLYFMEKKLAVYEKKGDRYRADRLRHIIREFKAMLDEEQQTLSSL